MAGPDHVGPDSLEMRMEDGGSKRGRVVSIEVLRRLAARRSGSAGSPERSPSPPPFPDETLPDEARLDDAIKRLEENLRKAYRLWPSDRERLLARLRADLDKLPDVRSEKVIEAKQRISSGYYDNDEVRREILRSLLESIVPPHMLEDTPHECADELRETTDSRIEEARDAGPSKRSLPGACCDPMRPAESTPDGSADSSRSAASPPGPDE